MIVRGKTRVEILMSQAVVHQTGAKQVGTFLSLVGAHSGKPEAGARFWSTLVAVNLEVGG